MCFPTKEVHRRRPEPTVEPPPRLIDFFALTETMRADRPQLGDSRVAPAMRCQQRSSLGVNAPTEGGWGAGDGKAEAFARASGANFCAFSQGRCVCVRGEKASCLGGGGVGVVPRESSFLPLPATAVCT